MRFISKFTHRNMTKYFQLFSVKWLHDEALNEALVMPTRIPWNLSDKIIVCTITSVK